MIPDAPEVIVAGGGSAGLAAALAAARQGASTLLIERQSQLGGMGTNALVHTFCGLFHPDVSRPWAWLNAGVPTQVGERMLELSGQTRPDLMGRVYVLRQHPALFARIADELCAAEAGLTVVSGCEWTGLERADDGRWSLELVSRGRRHRLRSKALVDTTGDATAARLLNPDWCRQAESSRLYRPACIGALQQVGGSHDDTWRLRLSGSIVRAVKDRQLPESALGAAFRDSPFIGEVFITVDLEAGRAAWDPWDPVKRAEVEAEGRATLLALWRFLRSTHADFQACPPPQLPAQTGIREMARYLGDQVLSGDDLAGCRRFDDEVALAGWPMEMRETARGPRFRHFDRPEPAGIPAGCLRQSQVPGLFFAGRCLSADHEALASLRVMGTCMATGQAAGRMAADHAARF